MSGLGLIPAPEVVGGTSKVASAVERCLSVIPDKKTLIEAKEHGENKITTVSIALGCSTDKTLCSYCSKIAFEKCLSDYANIAADDTETDFELHVLPIEKILEHRNWCLFCKLLFESVCQTENDLFKPSHIKDHLPEGDQYRNFKTWAEHQSKRKWKTYVLSKSWPFGRSRDQKEIAKDVQAMIKGLLEMEGKMDFKDVSAYQTRNHLSDAAQIGGLGLGFAGIGVAGSHKISARGQKLVAGAHMGMSQLATRAAILSRRLTCWFVVKVNLKDHLNAGLLHIRTYGHGRKLLAPLKEICRFNLRIRPEELRALEEPQDSPGRMLYGRFLKEKIDIEFFRRCLQLCEKHHQPGCNTRAFGNPGQGEPWSCFRLIDVKRKRLIEPKDFTSRSSNDKYSYAALSYCWGPDDDSLKLLRCNRADLMHRGVLAQYQGRLPLPRTIEEAISITNRMGKTYLWVDRLCIIQDPDSCGINEDMTLNFRRMDEIYHLAAFTIVAAGAENMHAGFDGFREGRLGYSQVIETIAPKVCAFLPLAKDMPLERWNCRAWTLQEQLFSRRFLVFSKGFATWRCRSDVCHEDVNGADLETKNEVPWLGLDYDEAPEAQCTRKIESDGSTRLFRPPRLHQYLTTVAEYTRREMSKKTDVLFAFAGIQHAFTKYLGTRFRYGMPESYLDTALLWQTDYAIKRHEDEGFTPATGKRCPPSWSWAGWEAKNHTGSNTVGSNTVGSNTVGSNTVGSNTAGSNTVGSNTVGSNTAGSDTVSEHSKGPSVYHQQPFNVRTDEHGALVMQLITGDSQEERLRPIHRYSGVYSDEPYFREFKSAEIPSVIPTDWNFDIAPVKEPSQALDDRHLVFRAETVEVVLRSKMTRITKYEIRPLDNTFVRTAQDTIHVGDGNNASSSSQTEIPPKISHEHRVYAKSGERRFLGFVKLDDHESHTNQEDLEVVALSESQFDGVEKTVDVTGYSLLNVLVIKKDKEDPRYVERVGLGKVDIYPFRRACGQDSKRIIVLR